MRTPDNRKISRLRYSKWNFQAQFHSQVCKLLQDIALERNQEEDFDYEYREGNLLEEDNIFEKEHSLRVNWVPFFKGNEEEGYNSIARIVNSKL